MLLGESQKQIDFYEKYSLFEVQRNDEERFIIEPPPAVFSLGV